MKDQTNQQDKFLHAFFKDAEVKEDLGITERIMHQIQQNPIPSKTTYTPTIGKPVWLAIACSFVGILMYALVKEMSFAFAMPTYMTSFSTLFNQLKSSFHLDFALPSFPSLSMPYLTVLLVFNIVGMYFMMSYRGSRRA